MDVGMGGPLVSDAVALRLVALLEDESTVLLVGGREGEDARVDDVREGVELACRPLIWAVDTVTDEVDEN